MEQVNCLIGKEYTERNAQSLDFLLSVVRECVKWRTHWRGVHTGVAYLINGISNNAVCSERARHSAHRMVNQRQRLPGAAPPPHSTIIPILCHVNQTLIILLF